MPELPEVETIARQLRGLVVDRTISEFESRWVRLTEPEPAEVVGARLRGRRISDVRRRGKFVVFDLDGGEALVVSLRMTGKLLYGVEDVDERYVRGEIRFSDGTAMRFSDTRKFGRMAVIDASTLDGSPESRRPKMPLHASLGQEPLARGFTVAWLRALLCRRPRAATKVLLLDQRAIAGIGNIYAIEALWRARIHPLRKAGSLRTAEIERLHEAIRWALRKGIRLGGASPSDYVDARGRTMPALRPRDRADRRRRPRYVPLSALPADAARMSVLSVQAVAKRFGERLVFSDVSFRLAHGDRVGLVGPNGVGKTTLLRVAAGLDSADAGNVALARDTRIGFMEQEVLTEATGTVEQHALGAAAHLRELEAEMHDLEPRLGTGDEELLERYSEAQHQFEHAGGYDFEATVGRVLGGLGLDALRDREVATLSGGERTRLGLARLLLDDPDLLLLDEPTNHLDVAALEWLERFLIEQDETILVSSHDRWFLDRVTSRTLSFEKNTIVEYRGGYSSYARQRVEREAATEKAAARQAIEIERTEEFIRRYGAGQRSKEARGRGKKLARVERIAAPERAQQHGWKLEAAHLAGDTVVQTTPLAVGYGSPLVRTGMLRVARDARIAVVGPNGAGKTTLVRTLVGDLAALEGYVQSAPTARVAFLAQAQRELTGDDTVLDAIKLASGMTDAEARDHLARFLFRGEDVFKSVGVLSGGERSRLALARLAARHANLLVLDEPTNHLDLLAREQLETVLDAFEGALVFVSHDRYFIDKLATEIWPIEQGVLKRFEGNWSGLQRLRASNIELPMPELTAVGAASGTAAGPAREARVPQGSRATAQARSQTGKGARSERAQSRDRTRGAPVRSNAKASPVRRVDGMRALEARISAMELQLRQLSEKVSQIAQSGNYMETRRVGEEYASLERSLRELYDEWAKESEKTE